MLVHVFLYKGEQICTLKTDCVPEDDDYIEIDDQTYKIRQIIYQAKRPIATRCSESNGTSLYKTCVKIIVKPK